MSRFDYTKTIKTHNPDSIKQYIKDTFSKAKNANLNMIFFQVRGNGDAFYKSNYEPWSNMLTGTLGKDPGWDPLEFATETAHELGLELHAWINTFPAWRGIEDPINTIPIQP
ncbi:MAG: family 10 glycosylhydrolase, partial [Candidatus Marinimicrobia bacterium]|nr:family 10 glycosylhydrolase [Candidatus Neomarinimicrobiota bacterium]